jgi:hypothetical protein
MWNNMELNLMNIEYTNTLYHIVFFNVLKDMKCFQNDIIKYNPHFYIIIVQLLFIMWEFLMLQKLWIFNPSSYVHNES